MSDPPILKLLYQEPYRFDFFQAVRLLHRTPTALMRFDPHYLPAGEKRPDPAGPPLEVARFAAHLSHAFPASSIYDLTPADDPTGAPRMTTTFLGLFGPSGMLPAHYTQRLIERERGRPHNWTGLGEDYRRRWESERTALRDWFDVFNHRFTYLFYWAWEKYRFWIAHERGAVSLPEPDPFTRALLGFVGLGTRSLRGRLSVAAPVPGQGERELATVREVGLLRFAGLLAQRHRTAWGLRALLAGYFGRPVEVEQFQGQWLPLEESSQSQLGDEGGNGLLGETTVVGDRVWDVQGKVRIRLGPLRYVEFLEYLPDRAPVEDRKAFFLLSHVTRLYLGPEFDFDVQLILRRHDVPPCELSEDRVKGPRLGWNCWLLNLDRQEMPAAPNRIKPMPIPPDHDAEDAVFEGDPSTVVGVNPRRSR